MDRYKETFNTWNNIASLYNDKFSKLDLYDDTYDFICKCIQKHESKLLEIGCGPGNITKYLLSNRPDFDILGIDIAPNMVELAKLNCPTAKFAVMDCRQIGTLNAKFDGIIGGFCLPYLSQIECDKLIMDSYDLLNDNGLLYISFVEGEPDKSDFKVGSGGRVYFYYHNIDDVIGQLKSCGFEELNTFRVQFKVSENDIDIHTILTAKKKALTDIS
ncbi:MAG: class I SAM-dependent methyltransferase [Ferruginibacter sp.]|nr:class I SAM-dependent methyltransferase [Ferruginibacter sp.]